MFVTAFAVRALYALELAPVMYSPNQPGTRMSWRYHETASSILRGDGILWPRDRDPARTGLLARPPGYATFLAGVYATLRRSFFAAQLVQNALTSLACVLLALASSALVGARAGLLAGFIAALSPHLGFVSNLVLPDALSALPLVAALLLLSRAHPDRAARWWWSAGAGALVGLGVWLRPNVVLLAPLLSLVLLIVSRDWRRGLGHAVALAGSAVAAVAPITVRNYVIFHELVPVSINGGLTFWQGVADAGGEPAGARRRDKLVMEEEAVLYGNPRYREWWAEPDGIWRDRERYRRAREVIAANRALYAKVALGRMAAMLHYSSGDAPTVTDRALATLRSGDPDAAAETRTHDLARRPSDEAFLLPGRWASPLRVPIAWAQSGLVLVLLPLVVMGTVSVAWTDWRRALLLLAMTMTVTAKSTAESAAARPQS